MQPDFDIPISIEISAQPMLASSIPSKTFNVLHQNKCHKFDQS